MKDDLKSETSGNFRVALKALVTDRPAYEAKWLNKAMKGLGTDETLLIEILATRSNSDLYKIKEAYKKSMDRIMNEGLNLIATYITM